MFCYFRIYLSFVQPSTVSWSVHDLGFGVQFLCVGVQFVQKWFLSASFFNLVFETLIIIVTDLRNSNQCKLTIFAVIAGETSLAITSVREATVL